MVKVHRRSRPMCPCSSCLRLAGGRSLKICRGFQGCSPNLKCGVRWTYASWQSQDHHLTTIYPAHPTDSVAREFFSVRRSFDLAAGRCSTRRIVRLACIPPSSQPRTFWATAQTTPFPPSLRAPVVCDPLVPSRSHTSLVRRLCPISHCAITPSHPACGRSPLAETPCRLPFPDHTLREQISQQDDPPKYCAGRHARPAGSGQPDRRRT